MKPISVQLYSLREEASRDFVGVLKKVAAIGYKGVEPAGFWNLTPREFARIVRELGMVVSSTHSPWVKPDNISEVIEVAGELGIDMVACGFGTEEFKDMEAIKATADKVNLMQEKLEKAGLVLFQHNHYWEFEKINGRLIYDIYAGLCPKVKFELDTYWAANFGKEDPAAQVKKFRDRCVLLHIKDGMFEKEGAMVAVGSGKNDIKGIVGAIDENVTKWLVVELDRCDTDMFVAVEQSYKFMINNKLAKGNK